MNESRKKLFALLSFKHELIVEALGQHFKFMGKKFPTDPKYSYIVPEDIEELLQWTDDEVEKVITEMSEIIEYESIVAVTPVVMDGSLCPWCLRHKVFCKSCGYGERHGVCNVPSEEDNTYKMILNCIDANSLSELSGMVSGIRYILNYDHKLRKDASV